MTPSTTRLFRVLSREALADAVRRRIVLVVAATSLLSLTVVDRCTSCAAPTLVSDGRMVEVPEVAGWSGMIVTVVLALWTMILSGILASDHLAETLEDGSATLTLARPVGRGTFALSRLTGALVISIATGAILLFATAALLHVRHGLGLVPAVWVFLACAGGAVCVGALAMTASLALPRIATALLVFLGVGVLAGVNASALAGLEPSGLTGLLNAWGPPLCSALVLALAPWIEGTPLVGDPVAIGLRLSLWAVASVA